MNPPRVYTCSTSRTPLPPPSPYHPSLKNVPDSFKRSKTENNQSGKSDEKFEWVCFLMELVSALIGRSVVMLEID